MLLDHTGYYYYRLFPAKFILFHFQSQPEEHDGPSFIRFTARRGTIDSLAPTPSLVGTSIRFTSTVPN